MSLSASAPWLKYYGEVPHHLTYPQKTIYQMVRDAAIRDARLPAYEFMGKKTTFAQFMEKIDQTAQAFLAMGIQKGRPRDHLHAELPAGPARVLRPQPYRCGLQHDPSALRRGRDQVLPQLLALQVHPHARPVLRQDRPHHARA